MKILQINNYHSLRGGSDRIYLETGALLEQCGHEVMWFAGRHPENLPIAGAADFPSVAGLARANPVELPKFIFNREAAKALDAKIRREGRPDIAHLHIYHGGLTTAILPVLRHHRIPVVQTAHEYKLACPTYRLERDGRPCFDCITGTRRNVIRNRCAGGSFSRSLAQWAEAEISAYVGDVRLVDRIICVSKRQSDLLAQAGVPKDKLGLCYNFVDTTRFAPDPGLEKGDYFLYFGRIEQLKGVEVLLDAARVTGLPVKFVGHGTWTDPLQARISGIPTATYLGQQSGPALRRLVAQARAVVVPSIWEEPFGLTVAEALASGTAVIGSRIGAIPEILRDGIDGHLVAPRDSAALSRAMQAMTAEQADRMGRTARDYARSRFAPDTYISNLLNIYSELLAFTA